MSATARRLALAALLAIPFATAPGTRAATSRTTPPATAPGARATAAPRTTAPGARATAAPRTTAPGTRATAAPAAQVASAPPASFAVPPIADSAPLRTIEGRPYLAAGDLARLLSATRYWRADVRKLVLRAGAHRVQLTADNPFVLVDDRTVRLGAPVRALGGELVVPADLIAALPRDTTLARLMIDPRGARVVVVPRDGLVGSPRVAVAGDVTRVTIPAERTERVQVIGRSRARFRVRLAGAYLGAPGDSLPAGGLVRRIVPNPTTTGTTFELALAGEALGYRVSADSAGRRVTLEFARMPQVGLEPFAAEGPAGPRAVRVIVLDPAHGGTDLGVQAGGAVEKDLTLALARLLAPALGQRLGARVVLTRTDDRALPVEARAEAANRAHADLVLVLHFDGNPAPGARGATAYCPPATLGTRGDESGLGNLAMIPWRDVALRHAVESRALADAVMGELDRRGQGPVRVRETMPLHLLGVNAPGVALECATLSSAADRARISGPDGLAHLAAAIAEGVAVWQRNE